jgi:tRNA(Ile)-lysidine synthase TilS/MesJ
MGLPVAIYYLKELTGYRIEEIARANRREFCAICGLVKRYYLNKLTLDEGLDTLATGHHLDDEAGRLLGNIIHHRKDFLDSQWPVLLGLDRKLAKRIKPLCRLTGSEIKSYAKSKDLPIATRKCPRAKGATLNFYQEALNLMETRMPGTKRDFYFGFLAEKSGPPPAPIPDKFCERCGAPTYLELCNCCRMLERTAEKDSQDKSRE